MPTIAEPMRSQLNHYASGPKLVREAIAGLDAGQFNRRPLGSDWSIRDIVMHLLDSEVMAAARIRMVIAHENPLIQPWDESLFKRKLHYLWRDPEAVMAAYQVIVFTTADLLEQCDAKTWERTGEHPERGMLTLARLLQDRTEHLDAHLAQIATHRAGL